MKSISILGCGWLGLPLAESLVADGFNIKGSTTTDSKLNILRQKGIEPYKIILDPNLTGENINEFFNSEILLINIPPKRRENLIDFHFDQIKSLTGEAKRRSIKKVIFISSTSVYGNKNREVFETDELNPETESGKALVKVEEFLQSQKEFKLTIIRFAGLVDKNRFPAKYVLNNSVIENADTPLNLIHLDDCIGIIKKVIVKEAWGQIFNGVCSVHPTRREFYSEAAKKFAVSLPTFIDGTGSYKIVNEDKTREKLDYKFKYSNPLETLYDFFISCHS